MTFKATELLKLLSKGNKLVNFITMDKEEALAIADAIYKLFKN